MRQVAVSGRQDEFRVLVIGDSSAMLATQKKDKFAGIMHLTTRLQMILQQQILTKVSSYEQQLAAQWPFDCICLFTTKSVIQISQGDYQYTSNTMITYIQLQQQPLCAKALHQLMTCRSQKYYVAHYLYSCQ